MKSFAVDMQGWLEKKSGGHGGKSSVLDKCARTAGSLLLLLLLLFAQPPPRRVAGGW